MFEIGSGYDSAVWFGGMVLVFNGHFFLGGGMGLDKIFANRLLKHDRPVMEKRNMQRILEFWLECKVI